LSLSGSWTKHGVRRVRAKRGDMPSGSLDARDLEPLRLLEVELEQGVPAIPLAPRRPRRTAVLVRLHGRPLGVVGIDLAEPGLAAEELARRIWHELGEAICRHLGADGLPLPRVLRPDRIAPADGAACLAERRDFLARAPFATIVVATRDRPKSLAACLDSLIALEYPRYEIVVVDNASATSAAADLVHGRRGHQTPVRYVREGRLGLSVAHNRGLQEARGTIVAFTDDDVVVDRLWLLELARGLEAAQKVGCVTGLILPLELETPEQVALERYARLGKGFSRRAFDLGENRFTSPLFPYAAGLFGSGANMAFPVEVLRRLGGFDPAMGAGTRARGGDDLAAFFEVIFNGYTLIYEPAAIVRHRHPSSLDSLERQLFDYGAGLTAYLTKIVLDRPDLLLDIVRRLPHAVAHALWPHSDRNAGWQKLVPHTLVRAERRGMLYGPFAYIASRRKWAAGTVRSGQVGTNL